MLSLGCSVILGFALTTMPQGPRSPGDLPTPDAVKRQLLNHMLANYKKSLAKTRELIKKIEEEPDPRVRESKAQVLKLFKELEASDLRRIQSLERGQLAPLERMPAERPAPSKPPARN